MECVLHVRAVSVAELISVAGGWLCDRAMAGWTTTVWTPQLEHTQSLAILGVTARSSAAEPHDAVDALVVAGASAPDIARGRHGCVRHRISGGARAFKARALLAAGLPPNTADVETFWLNASSNLLVAQEFVRTSASAVAP